MNYEQDIGLYTIKVATDPRTCNRVVIYRPSTNVLTQLELISKWEAKTGRNFKKIHFPEEEVVALSQSKPPPPYIYYLNRLSGCFVFSITFSCYVSCRTARTWEYTRGNPSQCLHQRRDDGVWFRRERRRGFDPVPGVEVHYGRRAPRHFPARPAQACFSSICMNFNFWIMPDLTWLLTVYFWSMRNFTIINARLEWIKVYTVSWTKEVKYETLQSTFYIQFKISWQTACIVYLMKMLNSSGKEHLFCSDPMIWLLKKIKSS